MKVIAYTLTENGEIPEYVTDGGYFAKDGSKPFPQNLILIGVANDDAPETAIVTKAELVQYIETYSPTIYNPELRQEEVAAVVVAKWWERVTDGN
jgi:hypothetical protein